MQTAQKRGLTNLGGDVPGCAFCMGYKVGLCAGLVEKAPARKVADHHQIEMTTHKIQARQMIHNPKEFSDSVIFICRGQAVSSVALADGRRQIIEVLLPGDIAYWTALFEPMFGRLIEAVEDSTYRKLSRIQFRQLLFKLPDLFEMFVELCTREKAQSDQLTLTLGRRNASQRIARLILTLADRLAERGLIDGQAIRFPLRLRHIGDATGLTPIHASKILSRLQHDKIINVQDRLLTISDMAELRQIAGP